MVLLASCNGVGNVFSTDTAKDKYIKLLKKESAMKATSWEYKGRFARQNPLAVRMPYAEKGRFFSNITDATAFAFTIKMGQEIQIEKTSTAQSANAFIELYSKTTSGKLELLSAADTLQNSLRYATDNGGTFVLLVHPTAASNGYYQLQINAAPSLLFPIDERTKSNIGSLWGDPRDGGARKHEGIDIFAARGSYVVAGEDATVYYTDETDIGGKVVSLRPLGKNYSIYHAHLDEQLVEAGQKVQRGQAIGKVGNSGNARNTPPHLHYGIYTTNGAIDPISFVQQTKSVSHITSSFKTDRYEFSQNVKLYPGDVKIQPYDLPGNYIATTQAKTNGFYRVILDNGAKGFVEARAVK